MKVDNKLLKSAQYYKVEQYISGLAGQHMVLTIGFMQSTLKIECKLQSSEQTQHIEGVWHIGYIRTGEIK